MTRARPISVENFFANGEGFSLHQARAAAICHVVVLFRKKSIMIIFSLMAHCKNSNRVAVLYLEQSHIACFSERNDKLAEKRICRIGFSTRKRELFKQRPGALNHFNRSFCRHEVAFREKPVQSFDIRSGFGSEPNTKAHPLSLAAFSMDLRESMTSSFEAYRSDDLAASRAANPRAINSFCVLRRSICARRDSSTKALSDSPSCNTLSAS